MNASYEASEVMSPTVTRTGTDNGRTTLRRNRRCPAPSIRAASDSSVGIERKCCRSRKIENTFARNGMICTWIVFPIRR